MNRLKRAARVLSSACLAVLLAACSGGGSSSSGGGGASVEGGVVKGPVTGGTVHLFRVNTATRALTELGTSTTGANGSYSVSLDGGDGPFLLVVTGGTFTDEATGATQTLGTTVPATLDDSRPNTLEVFIGSGTTGSLTGYLTPLSMIASRRVIEASKTDVTAFTESSVLQVNQAIAREFGIGTQGSPVDPRTVAPLDFTNLADKQKILDAPGSPEALLGALLGGISAAAAARGASPLDYLDALARDMEDGSLDGVGPGGVTVTLGGLPFTAAGGTTDLSTGITTFLNDPTHNISGLGSGSFTGLIAAVGTPEDSIILPRVSATHPENAAADVSLNQSLSATFSKTMDPLTVTTGTFTLATTTGGASVAGAVSYTGVTAIFNPDVDLAASTGYTATITTGAKDLAGNALASHRVWTFTTGTSADATPPTVSSTLPANAAIDVSINQALSAAFSETMDPLTVTTGTFTLATTTGGASVAGAASYSGVTATFDPDSDLAVSTGYTATITTGGKDLAGNALASDRVWTFTTGAAPDTTPPTVSSTLPANTAVGVPVNQALSAVFSEAMDPLTVTTGTFTLATTTGGASVAGAASYSGVTATFDPDSDLPVSTGYTATITTGVKDLAGNAKAANKVWTFTTGAAPDTTPPTVISTLPADTAVDVSLNQSLSATFSEAMDPLTITNVSFTLTTTLGGTPVTGAVSYSGVTATFNPDADLVASTGYTAMITTGVKDLAGNAKAADKIWNFTTGAAPDTTPPTVDSTDPADLGTGAPINQTLTAVFSEAMDPLTITNVTFTLVTTIGSTPVSGAVSYISVTATFDPDSDLAASTNYTATITTGATDLAGNALAVNKVWTFDTGATPAAGPAPVLLGTAGNYVILAKSAISTTGTTAVVGDLGLSPAAASFITGFGLIMDASNVFSTSSLVTGRIYAADYTAPTPANLTTAVSDMEIAYTDAAGRPTPDFSELGTGEIGGMTLVPGLYKWTTPVTVSTDVTLSGGVNDVWIFQIAGDLGVANGRIVNLVGGAQSANIFWQVAGQVTLGTTADFKGIVLGQTLMAMSTGAVMNGRVLVQTACTLDANAVTEP